jgi:hypothetical protein
MPAKPQEPSKVIAMKNPERAANKAEREEMVGAGKGGNEQVLERT